MIEISVLSINDAADVWRDGRVVSGLMQGLMHGLM